ncbi:hypothetical protein HNO89_002199 [Sporosarcina luteola]|nr:hypothetical protein [Sporosarcina luteola]
MRVNKFLPIILATVLVVSIFLPLSALANTEMEQQTYLPNDKSETPITEIESLLELDEDGSVETLADLLPLPMTLLVDYNSQKEKERYGLVYRASATQISKKFKHAKFFGVTGTSTLVTRKQFETALRDHVNNATFIYKSTYRGDDVFVFFKGKNLVYTDLTGNFISGWEYTSDQYLFHLSNGFKATRQ